MTSEPHADQPANEPGLAPVVAEGLPGGMRDAIRGPEPAGSKGAPAVSEPGRRADRNALATPGWFGWQFPFGVGVAAIGAAAARAGILAERAASASERGKHETWITAAGRIALLAPLGAALGLLAAWILAFSQRRPLGDWKLAAARSLAAVGLFHLVWRLGLAPTGFRWFDAAFAFALGFACYLGVIGLTFRLTRDNLLRFVAIHAALVAGAHAIVWTAPRFFRDTAPGVKESAPQSSPTAPLSSPTQTRPAGPTAAPPPAEQPPASQPPETQPPATQPPATPPPESPSAPGGGGAPPPR